MSNFDLCPRCYETLPTEKEKSSSSLLSVEALLKGQPALEASVSEGEGSEDPPSEEVMTEVQARRESDSKARVRSARFEEEGEEEEKLESGTANEGEPNDRKRFKKEQFFEVEN